MNKWRFAVRNQFQNGIGFHHITPVRNSSPVGASRISERFKRPTRCAFNHRKIIAVRLSSTIFIYGGNPLELALVETNGLPYALRQRDHQRVVGNTNGQWNQNAP